MTYPCPRCGADVVYGPGICNRCGWERGQTVTTEQPAATAHLAGNRVVIGTRAIQRCLLCGAILDQFDFTRVFSTDGSGPGEFEVGAWYEVEDGNPRRIRLLYPTEAPKLDPEDCPETACFRQECVREFRLCTVCDTTLSGRRAHVGICQDCDRRDYYGGGNVIFPKDGDLGAP